MIKATAIAAAAIVACICFTTADAAGTATRVWVSGHGVDQAGCGAPSAPCRSLQYAHDNAVAAGGEIDILDPAGYGAITITKALSIVNDGVGTAGVQATSGDAININAGANDAIYLKGLNLDGVNQSARVGVNLVDGGKLTIIDCVARHFLSAGIWIEPDFTNTQLVIADTNVSDNGPGGDGIIAQPNNGNSLTGIFDRVLATGNFIGISVAGGVGAGALTLAVTNTNASNNAAGGLEVSTGGNTASSVAVDASYFNNNGIATNNGAGIFVTGPVVVRIAKSTIDQNVQYGVNNQTTGSGAVYSAGDNHMDGNSAGKVLGPALVADGAN